MFILRIGAEALKNSNHSLSNHFCQDDVKHSENGKIKIDKDKFPNNHCIYNTKPVDQGILYNLLNKSNQQKLDNTNNTDMKSQTMVNGRPSSSNIESLKLTSNVLSIRPSSAPHIRRFHPYSKPNPVCNTNDECDYNHCEVSKNISRDQLITDWLRNNVLMMKPNKSGKEMLLNVLQLPDSDRIRILKQSWHLIFITYLVEFIENSKEKTKSILSLFIKDYNKTDKKGNYKKLFRLTKVFISDLEDVINQMISLRLNHSLFELLRIAILFTDNHEDIRKKNIELLRPTLGCRSDEYHNLFDQLLDNLFKLDMSMIESVFCGHLFPSVDSVIDELYSKL